jgi:hypothetical protein
VPGFDKADQALESNAAPLSAMAGTETGAAANIPFTTRNRRSFFAVLALAKI